MKTFFYSIGAGLSLLAITCLTGCANLSLAQKPATTHVVQVTGKVLKGGLVEDPVTGQYSLGYESGYLTVITVPISLAQNTNGEIYYAVPDVAQSYEVTGKNGLFGSAGSTYTVAVGQRGVSTLLGGQHLPVNEGIYGTNNVMVYQAAPSLASSTVPVTVSTSGTNSTQKPIQITP